MNKSKYLFITIIIFVLCSLGAYYLYLENNRFSIVKDKGIAYQIDKKTGYSWVIMGYKKERHEKPKPPEKILPLPIDQ